MDTVLSILMLAALALPVGAVIAWRKGARQQAWLMLAAALVVGVNLALWLIPVPGGQAPVQAARR